MDEKSIWENTNKERKNENVNNNKQTNKQTA